MDPSASRPPACPFPAACAASEEEVYAEHLAALEATLFAGSARSEVVLVLEGGRFEARGGPARRDGRRGQSR